MKTTTPILIGLGLTPILFFIGLIPAERLLPPGQSDSYILIGMGRAAVWVCGVYEFILGAVLATGVCMLRQRVRDKQHGTEANNTTVMDDE